MIVEGPPVPMPANRISSRPRSGVELRRRTPAITCAACQVIYLTSVPLPVSVGLEGWICGRCLCDLLDTEFPMASSRGVSSTS